MDLTRLPSLSRDDEEAWVAAWASSDDTDGLVEAITLALDERRPLLAARLFQYLEDHVEIEPGSPLERARTASRLILVNTETVLPTSVWVEMEDAWKSCRKSRMRRILARQRAARRGEHVTIPRVGRRPRRRS